MDVNVSPDEETIWMSQKEMASLFEKATSTINEHIKNILSEELIEHEVTRKFGKTELSTHITKPTTF